MDERERGQPKCYSIYMLVGHSKNRCPTVLEVPVKQINFSFTINVFHFTLYINSKKNFNGSVFN